MKRSKPKIMLLCLLLLAVLLAGVLLLMPRSAPRTASAAGVEPYENLNFTQVTDGEGNKSYSVGIKAAFRPTAEIVIIPETYQDLPVTAISNNGFMSCKKLERVLLPQSIRQIGNNAFMSCPLLKRISIPNVETIGANAFANSTGLKDLFIPKSVTYVGAYALRNYANTVYIQKNEEDISRQWDSSWSTYCVGKIVIDESQDYCISYREILNSENEVIGYEVEPYQEIYSYADVVIYNAYRKDDASPYLPVYNICSQAFAYSCLNSFTLKDVREQDETAGVFGHKVNLRSEVFYLCDVLGEVRFETGITMNHPADLNTENELIEDIYDGHPIKGDEQGRSVNIFAECSLASVTLPNDLEVITQGMFYEATALSEIRIFGDNEGVNVLPRVSTVCAYAFSSCSSLSSFTVPDSVVSVEAYAFENWGINPNLPQEINVSFYEIDFPEGWDAAWAGDPVSEDLKINYKPKTKIAIDLQDETGKIVFIEVIPDRWMPDDLDMPQKTGYVFQGIFSAPEGQGNRYYSEALVCERQWAQGEPETLFVHWKAHQTVVTLDNGLYGTKEIVATYGSKLEKLDTDLKGYTFYKYYYVDENGDQTIYYDQTGAVKTWDRLEETITLLTEMELKPYKITYEYDRSEIVPNPDNPTEFTLEDVWTEEIPLKVIRLDTTMVDWDIKSISKNNLCNLTVHGTWGPLMYFITYNNCTNVHCNPDKLQYDHSLDLKSPVLTEKYFAGWYLDGKRVTRLENLKKDITLEARWEQPSFVFWHAITTTLTVDQEYASIQINKYVNTYHYKIIATCNVRHLYISSMYRMNLSLCIEIQSTFADFNLIIDNLNIKAPQYHNAVTVKSNANLHLYLYHSTITGGDGIEVNGVKYPSGASAIYCNTLYIHTGARLYGGNGIAGAKAQGGVAVRVAGKYHIHIDDCVKDSVTMMGGNGSLLSGGSSQVVGAYGTPVVGGGGLTLGVYDIQTNPNFIPYIEIVNGSGIKPTQTPITGY